MAIGAGAEEGVGQARPRERRMCGMCGQAVACTPRAHCVEPALLQV